MKAVDKSSRIYHYAKKLLFSLVHCKWKKMDDMKVMFVFIRVMLADESYVPVNESYHYKMAFGLCAWKQT